MAGRRTNLALLVLLAAAVLTGGLAYGIGTSSGRVVTAAHAVVGVAIVALSPWKSIIARRGLRRSRAGKPLSLWLTGLVALALVSGVLHSTGALVSTLGITAMQVHVGAALVSIPLAIRHVRARPVHPRRMDLSRRQLLRSGALLGGSALAYLTVEWAMRAASVAGSRRRFTGSFETGTFDPEAMPVTQWLDDSVQEIEPSAWTLELRREGRVERLEIERLQEGRVEVEATLDCTGGWFARQRWEGVPLEDLIDGSGGRSVVVRSATGYARSFPRGDAGRLLLATHVGGRPLEPGHGAPARLVAPGRRGFWWVKWVSAIEVSDRPWWLQPPFPLS